MDHKLVEKLEREIEDAIRGVVAGHRKPPRLPLLPSHHTIHLMAKAAVAVYEAAAESLDEERLTDESSE
jgi:hypothetical protein